MPEVAIVAALRREVWPAVKGWRVAEREHEGRRLHFYENRDGRAVLVCGGIGPGPARRACEAAIALYQPATIVSFGFAGALQAGKAVGEVIVPERVIDASDGSSVATVTGSGILLSFDGVASAAQKARLAQSYPADAVDMEAAAVGRGAQARSTRFMAVKAITDGAEFEFPCFERFITADGAFRTVPFAVYGAARPWLWPVMIRMARNSARARQALAAWLERFNRPATEFGGKSEVTQQCVTGARP
jgi:nucleoside phosphorylase